MTSRSLLAILPALILPALFIAACFIAACSTPPSSSSSTAEAGLLGDGSSDGAGDGSGDGGSDSAPAPDGSDSLTFSACLLGGTAVHSIVLVATGKSVCAQVAAYTVVDPSQPPASSKSPAVTTTPSAWAYRGAFAGASTGSCDVGNSYPAVTDISGTLAIDPTDGSTISADVVIGYVGADGPKTLTISASDIAVAPTCP